MEKAYLTSEYVQMRLIKKFQKRTAITARAKARLRPRTVALMYPREAILSGRIDWESWMRLSERRIMGASEKAKIGVRMARPTRLTKVNWMTCWLTGFDLESG